MSHAAKTVLFLCTGNWYRSRFAEEVFNHHAPALCPEWQAHSGGLRIKGERTEPIHPAAVEALAAMNIPFDHVNARQSNQVTTADLEAADHIVALKQDEHLPLLQTRFADWLTPANQSRVEFWHVHDTDQAAPDVALPQIEGLVRGLMERLTDPAWPLRRTVPDRRSTADLSVKPPG